MKTSVFNRNPNVVSGYTRLFLMVFLVVSGGPCSGAPDPGVSSAGGAMHQPDEMMAENPPDSDVPLVSLHDGKVTVNMHSVELNQAISMLGSMTGIEFVWRKEENHTPVSLGFSGRSIEKAIQTLLHGENYLLVYSDTQGGPVISKVVILPSGAETDYADSGDARDADGLSPVPVADDSIDQENLKATELTPEIEMAMKSRVEGMDRVRSVAMQDDQHQAADGLKEELLVNEEAEARLLALTSLQEKGELSSELLMSTVSSETDPRVRLQAVNLLMERARDDPAAEGFLSSFFESLRSTGQLNNAEPAQDF